MCAASMESWSVDDHCSIQCPKRIYRCEYCNQSEGTYEEVERNHWPECKKYPVPCWNSHCDKGSIARADFVPHVKDEFMKLVR